MNIMIDAAEVKPTEKRQYKRIQFSEPIRFQSKDTVFEGGTLSCDLSEGGMRVNIYNFVPLGTEFRFHIRLAMEQIVEYVGRVVWVKQLPFMDRYQAGVEFSQDTTFLASKQKVHDFIKVA